MAVSLRCSPHHYQSPKNSKNNIFITLMSMLKYT